MAPIATADLEEYYPVPFPKDAPTIPLEKISVKKLLDGDEDTAQAVFRVCSHEGFFYLDLTTDPRGQKFLDESNQLHHVAKQVFNNVSIEDKLAYKPGDPMKEHLDWGYKNVSVGEDGEPNKAEFVNISANRLLNDPDNYDIPSWLNAHTDLYASFLKDGNVIGQAILNVLERELHLQPGELTSKHQLYDNSGEFLRLFRYPAPKDGKPSEVPPTPAHTDATSITILFNWQGGLQITKPKESTGQYKVDRVDADREGEEWLYVKPEPGHVIVNLGDPMVIFTNGVLKSGRHQVVTPPGPQALHHRYSVLMNLRPTNDTPMRSLKSDVIPPVADGEEDGEVDTALQWSIRKVKAILDRMSKK